MQATVTAAGSATVHGADHSYILATGFGTTVAMWAIGYVSRIPPAVVPSWLLLVFLLACTLGGGFIAGRSTGGGWRAGLWTGIVSAGLNLLVLGSLLTRNEPNRIVPSALWYIPGSIVIAAALGALGGAAGSARPRAAEPNWTGAFAKVAASATFFLLIVGGFVTSERAGLSVVDWPNSFGYGMFLYPLSRMTGGIYYEHAHRLFGSLVGLTTLVLAIHIQRVEKDRRWLRGFALAALGVVIVQGLLGGLRVTGRFTMSDLPADTAPKIGLAVVHGVVAQIFFAMIVAIGAFTTRTWKTGLAPTRARSASTDHALSALLVGMLIIQIVLGAIQRHLSGGLLIHITMAAFVLLVAISSGARAWGLYGSQPVLRRLGRWVIYVIAAQVMLGIASLVVRGMMTPAGSPMAISVIVRTAHQATGAILLACSVLLMLWSRRLLVASDE